MTGQRPLSAADQAIDHQLSDLGTSIRFILDVTPIDTEEVRRSFLGDPVEPSFTYRELVTDPEVLQTMLVGTKVPEVTDPTLGALLRTKHRELECSLSWLGSCAQLYGENFSVAIIEDLERKVSISAH